jgi:hypothetical protein
VVVCLEEAKAKEEPKVIVQAIAQEGEVVVDEVE